MRSHRRTTALTGLLVAALALTGCAAPAIAPAAAEEPPAPPVAWAECGTGLDCATYPVPVDHADPDGPTVPLALVRHRATDPAARVGALLINPGGPGGPAADLVRQLDSAGEFAFVSPEIAARFDVIAMDPRGVGESQGVRCLTDEQREAQLAVDLDPDVPGGMALPELLAQNRALAEGCAAGVDPALLDHMATDDVARDMDLVRAGIGEERISYLGMSYGTLLGATYATMFPERVDRMVLDAAMDPELWRSAPLRATLQQGASGEQQLDRWFETCRAEGVGACPFGAGEPEAAIDALIDGLEERPLDVPASPTGPAGSLDGADALLAARTAVFDRRLWPVLTAGLVAAQSGDGSVLLTLSQALTREPDGTPSGLAEANYAVNCLDRDVPDDLAAHAANAEAIMAAAPRFGALSSNIMLGCVGWPADNPDRFTEPLTARGAGPILVVGGREDSQTPYAWAQALTAGLDEGHLLTREGVGHGSYRASGPCIDAAVDGYLLDEALPTPGATCPQEPPATTALPTGG
ncbi:alpha/beta hydrolase [Pseudonocardia lacus]|uniref:alpha/beta hydrolase n=1 Tax=Pseudonocardia lacus TaxID=2835865 RepID=UPI001BDCD113|nr:alpha/beta hydrolase [Pseudonocardia lacus]